MDTNIFIDDKINRVTNELTKENNKNVFISGNFNFYLLKQSYHAETANFHDKMTSKFARSFDHNSDEN